MSLNGLDANAVVGAHQSALADAGGWFLLKYVNRDTVEVLGQGNGGVAEAKAAVAQYDEKSPLFGMVQYRRKRVVLKYVPEGTSRLLQVRLTVQFQSILDAFPHDAIFPFTASAELVESALGMCTMLQPTNGGSLQSSDSSLKPRRLNEITEDAEDVVTPTKKEEVAPAPVDNNMRTSGSSDLSTLPASAIRAKALLAKRKEAWEADSTLSSTIRPPRTDSRSPPPPLPPVSALNELVHSNVEPPRPHTSLSHVRRREEFEPSEASQTLDPDEPDEPLQQYHSRHLSENENDKISQWNAQVAAYTLPMPKPKKKLGPRIHVEPQTRPKTAGPYDDRIPPRQIANLPQTVRVSSRPPTSTVSRPGSQQSSRSVPSRYVPPVGIPPPLPDQNPLRSLYKLPETRKAGSTTSPVGSDSANISPEKMRLMKALQQRKRTQILTQRAASAQPSLAIHHDDFPLQNYPSAKLNPSSPVPATIPEEVVQPSGEAKSFHAPSTASPTSVATTAENTSTRPSSFADDCNSHSSRRSVSLDTDSSSTPKALADTNRNASTQNAVMEAHAKLVANGESQPQDSSVPLPISTQEVSHAAAKTAEAKNQRLLQTLKEADASSQADNKRRLLATGLTVPAPSTEASSVFSDDDALIAELQSATVQEATPISVVRPPSTPTVRKYSASIRTITKSGSNPSSPPKSTSSSPSTEGRNSGQSLRGVSTALPVMPPPPEEEPLNVPLTRKNTLGDGISKRIKALEVVTRRETVAPNAQSVREASATRATFTNLMKRTSFISQFQSSGMTSEKSASKDLSRLSQLPTSVVDNNAQARPPVQRQVSATTSEFYTQQQRGETISVTARIVREQDRPFTSTTEFYTNSNMGLHRSPLVIEHARQDSEVSSPSTYYGAPLSGLPSPSLPSPMSDKKRFSFASHLSNSAAKFKHSDSMVGRLSLTSNKRASRASASETSSVHEDRRSSRASRLMKRMSGLGNRFGSKGQGTSIKDGFQPDAIMEHHEAFIRPGSVSDSVMQMIDIGHVNVQFPETLLWKRRFLRIDDQGYLVFTAPTDAMNTRSNNRKFHLADIQEPCLPDSERAEMAWSVLLDLRDGNCIQCACENKESQIQVLKMLLDAHSAYHSLYPGALD